LNRIKRALFRLAVATLALLTLTYACDYLALRYQIPSGRPQFGQVNVDVLYAIHQKMGKTEYQLGPQETDQCVHSLFPHFGCNPCWYVNRHTEKRIDI
jgi:hypothetical protein